MSTQERIIHAILFELIALGLIVPAAALFTDKGAASMMLVGVGLSVYTVIWNYCYNIWFDRTFSCERASRTMKTRFWHTLGFEGGLIFVTVPVVAWFLGIGLLSALMLEAAFLIFFFVYAIGFNWLYDNMRSRLVSAS